MLWVSFILVSGFIVSLLPVSFFLVIWLYFCFLSFFFFPSWFVFSVSVVMFFRVRCVLLAAVLFPCFLFSSLCGVFMWVRFLFSWSISTAVSAMVWSFTFWRVPLAIRSFFPFVLLSCCLIVSSFTWGFPLHCLLCFMFWLVFGSV